MEHIRRFCVKKCMWTCAKLTEVHFFDKVIRWTPGFFVSCLLLPWVLSEFLFLTGVEGPLHWLPLHALRFPCCFLAVFTKLNSKVISTQVIDCPMRSMNANWTCSAVITSKCKKSSQDRRVSVCYLFFSSSNPINLYLISILLRVRHWVWVGRVKRHRCKNGQWNFLCQR